METRRSNEIQIIDWGRLDYGQALVRQHHMVCERIEGHSPDRVVLVEHPPVVTLGRSGSLKDLRHSKEVLVQKDVCLHKVDRGGKATFHGPGQLVVYPIVKVSDRDLHAFSKRLHDAVADVLKSYRLDVELKKGTPGLWVNGAKIASVGLAVRKWVVYHGIALNVRIDPTWFDLIVPCGQPDEKITSMHIETGLPLVMSEVKQTLVDLFSGRQTHSQSRAPSARSDSMPRWLVVPSFDVKAVGHMEARLKRLHLKTVCQNARCPNLGDCFGQGTATFMILGDRCTRNCGFCAIEKGVPDPPEDEEPGRIAMAVQQLGLSHAVVTSVTRDDLPDGGAGQFAATIRQIRKQCPGVSVEVLLPDFNGAMPAIDTLCAIRPEVLNHNIETIPRLYTRVRPMADYRRSLGLLSYASCRGIVVKSGLMLGLGETHAEVEKTLSDLKYAGCKMLTIGQYLAPTKDHVPVARYVPPREFEQWAGIAHGMGFTAVACGPLVRSSYRAGQMLNAAGCAKPHPILDMKPNVFYFKRSRPEGNASTLTIDAREMNRIKEVF